MPDDTKARSDGRFWKVVKGFAVVAAIVFLGVFAKTGNINIAAIAGLGVLSLPFIFIILSLKM